MKKIGESHYRDTYNDLEFDVYRVEKRHYYSRSLSRPNRWGSTQTANNRLEKWWNCRVGDHVIEGYGTKQQAVTGAKEHIDYKTRYAQEAATDPDAMPTPGI